MSKKMTPCERLGYKVGDKFTVIKDSYFEKGAIVALSEDDGSEVPWFTRGGVRRALIIGSNPDVEPAPSKLKPAKQALADAIHQNGGWVEVATFAVSGYGCAGTTDTEFVISFFNGKSKPSRDGENYWSVGGGDSDYCGDVHSISIPRLPQSWHQCILSRDEYFTAYPEQVKVYVKNETERKVESEMKLESEMAIKVGYWHKSGELPPVGEVCEAYIDYPPQWVETEIVAHKDGFAIGWCKSVMKGCHGDKAHEFRPLRTEREEAIDEMVGEFIDHYGNPKGGELYLGIAAKLYNAGYRKEVK